MIIFIMIYYFDVLIKNLFLCKDYILKVLVSKSIEVLHFTLKSFGCLKLIFACGQVIS